MSQRWWFERKLKVETNSPILTKRSSMMQVTPDIAGAAQSRLPRTTGPTTRRQQRNAHSRTSHYLASRTPAIGMRLLPRRSGSSSRDSAGPFMHNHGWNGKRAQMLQQCSGIRDPPAPAPGRTLPQRDFLYHLSEFFNSPVAGSSPSGKSWPLASLTHKEMQSSLFACSFPSRFNSQAGD